MSGAFQALQNSATGGNRDYYFSNVALLTSTTSTNGAQNNTFLDSSNNNFTVTRNGDTTQGSFNPFYPEGYWSNYFDGTGDYLTLPTAIVAATGDFTIEGWFNMTGALGTRRDIFYQSSPTVALPEGRLIINVNTTGTVTAFVGGTNAPGAITSTTIVVPSAWYHFAYVRNSNTFSFYINGIREGTQPTGTISIINQPLILGHNPTQSPVTYWLGYLSNIRVINGTALYTANFTPPIAPLTAIANTSLLTCLSNRFIDTSTNNFTITRFGDTRVTAFQPFMYTPQTAIYQNSTAGYSNYFDGSGDRLSVLSNGAFVFGTGDFTMEAWIFISTAPGTVFDNRTGTTSMHPVFYVQNTGQLTYYVAGAGRIVSTALLTNIWYHVALCRSSESTRMFVNGVQVGSTYADSNNFSTSGTVLIGGGFNSANMLTGYLSNVRIIKGTAVYTSNFTPSYDTLSAISGTSLLTCQSPVFIDNSSNQFAITVNGNTVTSQLNPYGFLPNKSGSAYFDGTGDYLTVGAVSSFNFLHNSTALFTVEGWVYTTASGAINTVITTNGAASASIGCFIAITATNTVRIFITRGVSASFVIDYSSTGTVTLNAWNHIAITYDQSLASSNAKIYINGVLAGTGNKTANAPSSSNATYVMWVGANQPSVTSPFTGYISNLRVVNSIVYTANFTPPAAPLPVIANTSLLMHFANSGIADSSQKNNLITVGNAQVSTTQTKFTNTTSMFFDGTGDYIVIPGQPTQSFGIGNFTIECWLYCASHLGNIVSGRDQATNGITFRVNSTRLNAFYGAGSGAITASTNHPVNQWFHAALVRSGTIVTLYQNGVAVGTTTWANTVAINTNITRLLIGVYITSGGTVAETYTGYIQDLRITAGYARYSGITNPTSTTTTSTNTTLLLKTTSANTFITDASVNNFQLTIFGDTHGTTFSPYLTGWSNYFDGSGDYLITSTSSNLALPNNTNWTVEGFVYIINLSTPYTIMFSSSGVSNSWATAHNLGLYINQTTGYLIVEYSNGTITASVITGTTPVTVNNWVHVAFVYNGTAKTITTYVNGLVDINAASMSTWVLPADSPRITIGRTDPIVTAPSYFYFGYISNFRMVSSTAVYTANFTPPTAPLTAITNTSLLTCQNNRLIDNSTYNFAITRNGDVTVVTTNPFNSTNTGATGGTYFDGTGDYLTTTNASLPPGTGSFTYECWIYIVSLSADRAPFNTRSGNTTDGFDVSVRTSGSIRLTYTSVVLFESSSGQVTVNQWYHLAVVRNVVAWTVFLNGQSIGTFNNSTNFTSTIIYIGVAALNANPYAGYISNFRYVKGTAVYTAAFTPPTEPLTAIANTSLLTLQNSQSPNTSMFLDNSANNFLITRAGDTIQGTFSPYIENGYWSNYFDGNGDYLSIPHSTSFQFGTGNFTIEAWIYPRGSNPANGTSIISKSTTTSFGPFQIGFNPSGTLQTLFSTSGSGWEIQCVSSINYTSLINRWSHVAAVRNGTTFTLYLNGTSVATTTNAGSLVNNTESLMIGYINFVSTFFTGNISNVRIVSGTAVYTSSFTPSSSPLTAIANTSLLTCLSNRFIDNSTNNFTITRNGDTAVRAFNPFATRPAVTVGSGYFDGTADYLTVPSNVAFQLGTGDFTIESWIYKSAAANGPIVDARGSATAVPYAFYVDASNFPYFYDGTIYTSSIAITNNQWNHIVVVRTSGTLKMFVNGVESYSAAHSVALNPSSTVYIGGQNFSSPAYTAGYISNLRIVKGTALYTSNFTPPSSPLTAIANTSLLINFNNYGIYDAENANAVETIGNAQLNTSVYQWAPSSIAYDGTGDRLSLRNIIEYNFDTGDFTLDCWIRLNAVGAAYSIISTYNNATTDFWELQITSTNFVSLVLDNTALFTGTTALAANTWYYIAVTRSGTALRCFVNGVIAASVTSSSDIDSTRPLITVGATTDGIRQLNGYIQDLRLIRGQALYTGDFTPPTGPFPRS